MWQCALRSNHISLTNEPNSQRQDDELHEQIPSGYRWPGNRLSYLDMRRLIYVSNKTKRPINQIIKEAVIQYTTIMIEELDGDKSNESS